MGLQRIVPFLVLAIYCLTTKVLTTISCFTTKGKIIDLCDFSSWFPHGLSHWATPFTLQQFPVILYFFLECVWFVFWPFLLICCWKRLGPVLLYISGSRNVYVKLQWSRSVLGRPLLRNRLLILVLGSWMTADDFEYFHRPKQDN